MEILKFKIIDGRDANIGCTFETLVNEEVRKLLEKKGVTKLVPVLTAPDYFVFAYRYETDADELIPP